MAIGLFLFDTLTTTLAQNSDSSSTSSQTQSELNSTLIGIISLAAGAGFGGIGTYITAVLKYKHELKAKYDISLRDKRIEVYQELWKRLEFLAKYSPPEEVNLFHLQTVSNQLRQWYFEIGGMFLTEKSRTPYFALQELLVETIQGLEKYSRIEVEPKKLKEIIDRGHDLRTILVNDTFVREQLKST